LDYLAQPSCFEGLAPYPFTAPIQKKLEFGMFLQNFLKYFLFHIFLHEKAQLSVEIAAPFEY